MLVPLTWMKVSAAEPAANQAPPAKKPKRSANIHFVPGRAGGNSAQHTWLGITSRAIRSWRLATASHSSWSCQRTRAVTTGTWAARWVAPLVQASLG